MELTRSIVSRLRKYMGDRRHAKRRKARLQVSVSVGSPAKGLVGIRKINSLAGHTLDVSPNGLALIMPAIRIGEQHLIGENRTLNVTVELPSGPVEMKVAPIRYEALDEHPTETGYLIGVRITEISDVDRATFAAYVANLPAPGARQT